MNDRLKEIQLLISAAIRTDPKRCLGALLEPLGALAVPLYGVLLGVLANGIVQHDSRRLLEGSSGLLTLIALQYLAEWVGTAVRVRLAEQVGFRFDQEIVQLTAEVPGVEHQENPDYLDRLELLRQGQGVLGQSLTYLATTTSNLIGALGTAAVLIWLNPFVLLIVLFVLPSFVSVSAQQPWEKTAEQQSARPSRLARHLRHLTSHPRAAMELRVCGLQHEIVDRMDSAWRLARSPLHGAFFKSASIAAGRAVLFAIGFVLAVGFVLWQASRGRAQPGEVVTAVIVCQQVQRQIIGPAYSVAGLGRVLRNAGRLLWLRDYARTAQRATAALSSAPERLSAAIVFDHVSFRYPGSERLVLEDVNVEIPAGSSIALIGENGAGKSTIVKLLCRLYEPTHGRILVDGIDLRDLDVDDWRDRLAATFQDFVRPEFTAGRAVGLGDLTRLDDQAAIDVAAQRGGAADVIAPLGDGADQQLGSNWENGVDLSGGQWQKLALSRGLMRQAPLMVFFDEPTASLDAHAEHELFARYTAEGTRMAEETGTITVLVTHRFSTVKSADLILVLDHGRLIEVGSHDDLVAAEGLYRELYEIQAHSYA